MMPMTEAFTWVEPDTDSLKRILRETRSVAIVGASDKHTRPSYNVWTYLKLYSIYDLYLVNPALTEVDGTRVYPSLADLPVVPDLVHVFRRYDELPSVLEEAIEIGAKTIWLPDWSWHGQVARAGEAAGLQVVMDRCLRVEHTRLVRV
jgi:predicted CoA-binding protein